MNKINKSLALALIIIFIVFGAIFITNFPFNSWQTGWDNLHPEFNFSLNLTRALSSVWQENQGLGTYGGHGYAATLPHTIFVFLMSFLIPIQYLRSSFTFLMLAIGTAGIFFLIRKLLKDQNEGLRNNAALIGSLFYMLNLGTIQQFYIQLEAFIIHFAALPWLFYTLIGFLENKTKKSLFLFLVVSLAATPQGFIPPLFVVYAILLTIFLLCYVFNKPTLERIKRAFLVLALTFLINAFWLLPVIYYTFTHSQTYLNSYNNLSSTGDFILKNKKYGEIADVALLKGFIFEAIDGNQDGKTFLIFTSWLDHFKENGVAYVGYLFFGIIILGSLFLIKDRSKYINVALFSSLVLSLSLLATNTFPFSILTDLMDKIPIIKQAFRVAFTKFSIATAFFYAIAFAFGLITILKRLKRYSNLITLILAVLLIYFSLPAFKGNFLYNRTKINIPDSYFQLFKFFNAQDKKTRIANLPVGWNWGWSIYRWGHSGSGFLWYGIPQPIMDRAFDAWGNANENYYWEISQTIFSENFQTVDNLMDKYKINWVVLDKNVVSYLNNQEYLYLQKTEEYLDQSGKFALVKVFKSTNPEVRDIKVYAVKLNNPPSNFQRIVDKNDIKNIGPSYNFTNYDPAYQKYGDYYTNPKSEYDTYYPFRSLFTNRKPEELITEIEENGPNITFKAKIPQDIRGYSLIIPPIDLNFDLENPSISTDKDNLIVTVPKNKIIIYESKNDLDFLSPKASDCQTNNSSRDIEQVILQDNILRFTSRNTQNCHDIILNQLGERFSYLISLESKHIEGRQLELAVINHQSKSINLDILLSDKNTFIKSYLVLPPMKYYGLGYSLSLNNISINSDKTINDIKNISIYRIPFYFLTHIELSNPSKKQSDNNSVFAFYQSYDPDWKAYEVKNINWLTNALPFLFGKELKEHVLVNNWANGWVLEKSKIKDHLSPEGEKSKIIIIFWPQYLEYLGFVVLIGTFVIILVFYLRKR